MHWSLPSRERGLKYLNTILSGDGEKSLPSRERGLKLIIMERKNIENGVAPLAGAWIEIFKTGGFTYNNPSLPSRERGLKLIKGLEVADKAIVAPLAGAWIEI